MGRKTDMGQIRFEDAANWQRADHLRVKQKSLRNLIAYVTTPLALLLVLSTTSVQAALRGQKVTTAASSLRVFHGRLTVVRLTVPSGHMGLRAGDQIIAVNGRRVSTEAAFMNRLMMTRSSTQAASIAVSRNGRLQILNVPSSLGSGFMNPDLMVMTSQGVMHRDAAARLGLAGTPITGSPEGPPGS